MNVKDLTACKRRIRGLKISLFLSGSPNIKEPMRFLNFGLREKTFSIDRSVPISAQSNIFSSLERSRRATKYQRAISKLRNAV